MKNKIILHIDMNSYFASVEQQANPFLRGRSVGVCAYLSPNGTIIASSTEAKAKGIKTGTKVCDAKILDPGIILVENEPAKYRSTTDKIFSILKQYTDAFEPYSIDEAFLDLTGYVKNFDEAFQLALIIKKRILLEVGEHLYSSVGISWTKFLAKFASDIASKKGILIIDTDDVLIKVLKDRPLTDAWGINKQTEIKLKALGINNLLELKNFDKDKIRRSLGRSGYYLWANVNGEEITSVHQGASAPKSIGHSYCLSKKTADKEYLATVLYKLCEKTGRRLRALELEAGNISVSFSYVREGHASRSFKLPEKIFTSEDIFKYAYGFLKSSYLLMSVRAIYISVSSLAPSTGQLSLFNENLSAKGLSFALDKINDKYGEYAVVRGIMFNTDDIAKDRVGFRKIN